METVFVKVTPDQIIEFSNGVKLTQGMVDKLKEFQLGFDELRPIQNDQINDLQALLVETGDAIHQVNYHGHLPESKLYSALENLWTVRKMLDVFRVPE